LGRSLSKKTLKKLSIAAALTFDSCGLFNSMGEVREWQLPQISLEWQTLEFHRMNGREESLSSTAL